MFSHLPLKEKNKKASYEINEKVYKDFDEFADRVGKPRQMSRNVLIEMALTKFMKDFDM